MSLTWQDKANLIDDIYRDFLNKVKEIELERDRQILELITKDKTNNRD